MVWNTKKLSTELSTGFVDNKKNPKYQKTYAIYSQEISLYSPLLIPSNV